MLFNYQKQQELKEKQIQAEKEKRRKARETIKKYNTEKNKGQAKNTVKFAGDAAKMLATGGFFSLLFEMRISDWMYWAALTAAIFKDTIDLITALIAGVPVIGAPLAILGTIITICVSIFIAMMMLLGSFSTGYGRIQQKIIRSYLVLLFGTAAEMLIGVGFLPIETITVIIIYAMALLARKQAKKAKEEENKAFEENYA